MKKKKKDGYCPPLDAREKAEIKEWRKEVQKDVDLQDAAYDLLEACRAQQKALLILFGMLIRARPGFRPIKSGEPWKAMLMGRKAIDAAGDN